MKAAILALVVLASLILAAVPVSAHVEPCLLTNVKVANDVSGEAQHTKTTIKLLCTGEEEVDEQVTKLVYKIPFADVQNFEASDEFGSLKVLEGPDYASAKTAGKETTIGVIFRKALVLSDVEKTYAVNFDFDSASLVSSAGENSYSTKPGNLLAMPKLTIVSRGVTEALLPVEKVDYELVLPEGASVQNLPEGCSLSNGKVACSQITFEQFGKLEVKWSTPKSLEDSLVEKFRLLFKPKSSQPGSSILTTITSKIKDALK